MNTNGYQPDRVMRRPAITLALVLFGAFFVATPAGLFADDLRAAPSDAEPQTQTLLRLTEQEQQWVRDHPTVAFTGDPNWLPYEAFEPDGTYVGIVAEHLKLIERDTGLRFRTIPVRNWTESLRIATEGKVAVISGDAADSILNKRFLPVDSYSRNPIVIIMDHRRNYVETLDAIADKKIAVIKDYGYTADIFATYPQIDFIEVENIQEGLEGVSSGQLDAMLATMSLASYHIAAMGLHNVRVVGKTPIIMDLTLFVAKDQPLLHSIINKALNALPENDSQQILEGWIRSKYVEKPDYTLVVQVGVALMAILLVTVLWNRRLKWEIGIRQRTEQALRNSEERFDLAMSVANDGIWDWNVAKDKAVFDDRYYTMAGYTPGDFPGSFDAWQERLHPDDRQQVGAALNTYLSGNQTERFDVSFRFRRKDGSYMWIRSRGQVVERDAGGNPKRILGTHSDITKQHLAEERIRLLSQALEQSPASVVITDTDGRIEYVNSAFSEITGFTSDDVMGLRPIVGAEQRTEQRHFSNLWNAVAQGIEWKGERENRKKNGEPFWEHTVISPVQDETGTVSHYLAISEDVSLRKQQEEHILHQAHYDSLTGLPNRFLVLDRLGLALIKAQRERQQVAVLFLDLDNFKKINDSLGHDVGDKLLAQAARRLTDVVRSADTVGRLGGDEFVILLSDLDDHTLVSRVAEAVVERFAKAFHIDSRDLMTTVSIGISLFPTDGDTPADLLRTADLAMYCSKQAGRNTYSYFTGEMNSGAERRIAIEEQMHGALERGEFRLLYQPQVEIRSGRIHAVEALLRWHNRVLGEVAPKEFIPIAEQSGLIVDIGRFVVTEALAVTAWLRKSHQDASPAISINISPRQFRDAALADFIIAALERTGVPPNCLELEITEGVLMGAYSFVDDILETLSKHGVRFALDDFGSGYASLSYLRAYPFNVLKIDRSFIADITHGPADRELVIAAIAMAKALGLKVVAEGVETADQLNELSSQLCDYAQGFLLREPVDADRLNELLMQGHHQFRENLAN
jgi:diguanylate cyclase (GGDEF)-like protein/PAS domain S-box-containing protein